MGQTSSSIINQFLDFFVAWDRLLFVKINAIWANPLFDKFFPLITDLYKTPVGLALLALGVMLWIFKDRERGWKFVVVLAIAIGACDLGAARLVKPLFTRTRPEFTQGLPVTLRVASTHSFSFPSSHACNMFAAATILWFALPGYGWWGLLIAALVAYSRVYVGVHFPLDVTGGAVLGFIVARIVWNFLGHWCEYIPESEPSTRLKTYQRSAKNPTGE